MGEPADSAAGPGGSARARRSGLLRVLRAASQAASSPRLGVMLLGLLLIYLAAASLVPAPAAPDVPFSDAGRPGWLYAAWPMKLLLGVLVFNVAWATLVRVRFSRRGLGALLAHAGVIVLAGGAAWYQARTVSGYAVAHRDPGSGLFLPMDRLYLEDTAAVYVGIGEPPSLRWVQGDIPSQVGQDVVFSRGSLPEGVRVRFAGHVITETAPSDDDVGLVLLAPPAVSLEVTDGQRSYRIGRGFYHSLVLWADDHGRVVLSDGTALRFQFAPRSRPLPRALAIAELRRQTYPASAVARDYVHLLAVLGPDGRADEYLSCRLNQPADLGSYRLYYHEWRPDDAEVQEVIFLVRSRPGMPAIWIGCVLILAGLGYAFFIRPLVAKGGAA